MGSRQTRQYYCHCGTRLAKDNTERQCARCQRASRDKLISPPEVAAEFWETEQFGEAFAAQHIGRVFRAYRTHPHHYAVYGPDGISQTLLGQWLGLRQPQVSRIETGRPIRSGRVMFDLFSLQDLGDALGLGRTGKYQVMGMCVGHPWIEESAAAAIRADLVEAGQRMLPVLLGRLRALAESVASHRGTAARPLSPAGW